MTHRLQRGGVWIVTLSLLAPGFPALTQAGIIDTATVLEASERETHRAVVSASLARSEVRERLLAFGVEPAHVEARLAALSDAELQRLAERIEALPAGGDALAVIGVVFLVLIILEFVGVIDIFKQR